MLWFSAVTAEPWGKGQVFHVYVNFTSSQTGRQTQTESYEPQMRILIGNVNNRDFTTINAVEKKKKKP